MSTAATPPPENPRRSGETAPADQQRTVLATDHVDKREVVRRQRERFGGMKFGACFFGWLTATGTAVLLTALLTAADFAPHEALAIARWVGGIALLVVVLLAYFCGGYVAGRMARFNGVKQGIGVWLWALIVAVVVALLSLIAGSQFNLLASVNGFPRIPINEGTLATGGIIAAIVLVAGALIGAVLGGLAGMRFHRRVDHADLSTTD